MLVEDVEQHLRRAGADLADRLDGGRAAQRVLVLEPIRVGDDRKRLLRLVAHEAERPAVEALEPVRRLALVLAQLIDLLGEGGLRVTREIATAERARVERKQ